MTIPKTFSAPADETFPALNGFVPSPEDSLRYAVWLMMMADDVNRRAYSYVPDEPERGVRISLGRPDYDPNTLTLTLPCQLIAIAVSAGKFTYATGNAGELKVVVGCAHIEAANSSTIRADVQTPSLTAETRLHRQRQILMRGTLYREGDETREGKLIDPYFTPLAEDGTYAPPFSFITNGPPRDIVPARKETFPNRRVRNEAELAALHPIKDFAVSFGWLAEYTVIIHDRDAMR